MSEIYYIWDISWSKYYTILTENVDLVRISKDYNDFLIKLGVRKLEDKIWEGYTNVRPEVGINTMLQIGA